MESKPIVSFDQFAKAFPRVKTKSKKLAEDILPLYSSLKLTEITAALLTDGHIDWYTLDGRPRTRRILLYSDNKKECKWFLKIFKDYFGIKGNIEKYESETGYSKESSYKAVVNNATLARILILAGIPAGDKTIVSYCVPNWIMKGDKKIKTTFLKTIFNFDGSVPYNKKGTSSWQMHYSMNKKKNLVGNGVKFLKQIKRLLKECGIKCGEIGKYNYTRNKHTLVLSFSNQESIVNFYQKVGFINPLKQKRLKRAIIEIFKKGRIKLEEAPPLLEKLKELFGTDKKTIKYVNGALRTNYTKRQFEHFRRNETKTPIAILVAAEKILKKKIEVPEWIRFLIQNVSVHSRH